MFKRLAFPLCCIAVFACTTDPPATEDTEVALTRHVEIATYSHNGHSMHSIHQTLFEQIENMEITAYHDYTFEHTMNKNALVDLMEQEERVRYNPNIDNPYYERDSVVVTPLLHDDVHSYRIVETFQNHQDNQYDAEIRGIAFMYNPLVDGTKRSSRPLLYLPLAEIESGLEEDAFEAFMHTIVKSMTR